MVSPLRRVPFVKRHKRNQKVSPRAYGASPGLGVPSLRYSSGGIAYGLLRDDLLSMCAAAPHGATRPPQINTSTRPPEGAGRSRAAGELTLGLLSGEGRGGRYADLFLPLLLLLLSCGRELARDGGLTADQSLPCAPDPPVGAGLPATAA